MSKHTKKELKEMAKTVIEARDIGDPKFTELVMLLSTIFGMSFESVHNKIESYALD